MIINKDDLLKFKPQKELLIVLISLGWMWLYYYLDRNVLQDNMLYQIICSLFLTALTVCVVLPVWWIAIHNGEGFKGLGITKKNILLSIFLGVILACWRGIEVLKYINNTDRTNLVNTVIFNMLSIWEVMFIFAWMFTRYKKSFGKIPAILLTSMSVGLYHLGSLQYGNIIYLMFCIVVCGVFYSITDNIFTLWPIYWTVGCSASTLRSQMIFSSELVVLGAVLLVVQLIYILIIYKIKAKNLVIENSI